MRLELARIVVEYTTCTLPDLCPSCQTAFTAGGALREVNLTESSFRGNVLEVGDEQRFDVDAPASMGEVELPMHPVRYECARCGLVLIDGAELVEAPERRRVTPLQTSVVG